MPKNQDSNPTEFLNSIGDMSFLPKETVDENYGREFPKIHNIEKYIRLGWISLFCAGIIAFLVCLFIYSPRSVYFTSGAQGLNFGVGGIFVTALFAIAYGLYQWYSFAYETKLTLEKDQKKGKLYKDIYVVFSYALFIVLYSMIFFTVLRPGVFKTYFNGVSNWFVDNLGIFIYAIVVLLSLGGIVIHFLAPHASKPYGYIVTAICIWVVVCFNAILVSRYSTSENYGSLFFILGAVLFDIAIIFEAAQKKVGFKTCFHFFLDASFSFEILGVFLYGMVFLR